MALALETNKSVLESEGEKRKKAPIAPVMVEEAPVKQVILKDDIDLLKTLPVLTYHEKDAGSYITQGVLFLKDPDGDARIMGVHRMLVKARNKLGVFFCQGYSLGVSV